MISILFMLCLKRLHNPNITITQNSYGVNTDEASVFAEVFHIDNK